ncbi:MAG: hypothetical protein IIZ78_19165 [Clostridiales bacterium]|nr:hypothetical protein [Clostridiales bacterium]
MFLLRELLIYHPNDNNMMFYFYTNAETIDEAVSDLYAVQERVGFYVGCDIDDCVLKLRSRAQKDNLLLEVRKPKGN